MAGALGVIAAIGGEAGIKVGKKVIEKGMEKGIEKAEGIIKEKAELKALFKDLSGATEILSSGKFHEAPLFMQNPSRLNFLGKFLEDLKDVRGIETAAQRTMNNNVHSARGDFATLARAWNMQKAGLKIDALNLDVSTSKGKTDIDVLAKHNRVGNIWIENKDQKVITNDSKFRLKIDKMAAGLTEGVKDKETGDKLNINAAVFINNGTIADSAKAYAKANGVHIVDKMNGPVSRIYVRNLIAKLNEISK